MDCNEMIEKNKLLLLIYKIAIRQEQKKNRLEEIVKLLQSSKVFQQLLNFERREQLGKLDIRVNGFKDEDRDVEEIYAETFMKRIK